MLDIKNHKWPLAEFVKKDLVKGHSNFWGISDAGSRVFFYALQICDSVIYWNHPNRQAAGACLFFASAIINSYLIMYKPKNPLFFPQEYDKI